VVSVNCVFPFGQPLRTVEQQDRSPKKVFVLGVYASAVHAKWVGTDGKIVVRALAVASEPTIFWRGEDADEIISRISVPAELGRLVSVERQLNGPSGRALDEFILKPLRVQRDVTWLCDLVPHSCVNPSQQKAICRSYKPLMAKHQLPVPSVPPVPQQLADDARRREIMDEIHASQAEVLVLLGDEPIRWFLNQFDSRWRRLSDFGDYGRLHEIKLEGRALRVLPLAHPRQIAKLGRSSKVWFDAHAAWIERGGISLGGLSRDGRKP
jgi:uracil-DNA glycosylase